MEGVSTFLESSTIHGLNYISTTKKYTRLFWILIISTGFLLAFLLIKESFDSWSERPFSTTVETLPIAEIKLPKVTVCPPKNTFTDLNYDLIMTENTTLTDKMRYELFKYALEVINEDSFSENNWTKLHEEDRFYNWYHGYTKIQSPYYDASDSGAGLNIIIETTATSGVVTTQHYGEKFMSELVERKFRYMVKVFPPWNVRRDKNATLHFKLDMVPMTGLLEGSRSRAYMQGLGFLDEGQTTAYTTFSPPAPPAGYIKFRDMFVSQDVSSVDVETQKLDLMPGFRLSWWYTGTEATPDDYHIYETINIQFIR